MAITNYTELQAGVVSRLGRSDLTSLIPEFIALGEITINKRLRLFQMQNVVTVTQSIASDTAALPAGFLELIDMRYSDFTDPLTQLNMTDLLGVKTSDSAKPTHFAVSDTFIFNTPASAEYTYRCAFYKKFDIATDTTNWLLTNSPNVYLYSALVEAALYTRNQERMVFWERQRNAEIKNMNNLDRRTKGSAVQTVDPALQAGFNARRVGYL